MTGKWWGYTQETMLTHFDETKHVRYERSGLAGLWDCLECKEMAQFDYTTSWSV